MPTPSAILSRARTWYAEPDQELLRFEMDWFLRWIKGGRGLALLIACAIFSFIPFVALVGWLMTYGVWLYLFQRRVSGRFAQANLQEMMVLPINGRMIWPGLLAAPFAWLVAAKILKAIVTLAWTQVLLGTETIGASAFSGAFHVPALWSAGSAFLGVFSSVAYAFAFSVMVGRHTVPRATFTRLILSTLLVMVLLGALSAVAMGALMFSPRMFIGQGIEIIWLLPLMGGPVLMTVIYGLIGWFTLKEMRSPNGWNRVIAKAQPVIAA